MKREQIRKAWPGHLLGNVDRLVIHRFGVARKLGKLKRSTTMAGYPVRIYSGCAWYVGTHFLPSWPESRA